MGWQFSPYLLPTFSAALVTGVLAVYAFRRRGNRAAHPFTLMLAGLMLWAFAYGVELGFTGLGAMLWWDRVAFVGSVVVPTAWLLVAVEYAGYEDWLTRRRRWLLAVEPAVTLALVWTNRYHGLVWRETAVHTTGSFTAPELVFGPAYLANVAYSYLLMLAGIGLFVVVFVRASRLHRRQSALLVGGALVPLGVNAVFNAVPRVSPVPELDLTTFAFSVTGVCFAVALFRLRLFELAPVARRRLVEEMDDGVLVLDADDRVVDHNAAAGRALDGDLTGAPLAATALGPPGAIERDVVSLDVDGDDRTYEVSSTDLDDFRGETAGSLVLLRDITELQVVRDQRQQLSVLNRILRHNVRNQLNVVTGRSDLLREDLPSDHPHREHVDAIDAAASRLLETSSKARQVPRIVDARRTGDEVVDVAAVVRETAARLADDHPAASVDVDCPASARASAIGRRELAVAIESLGKNAVSHNPADEPSVWLRVEADTESVAVTVRDDGPGLPPQELAALSRDEETPLAHSEGLGLWLARWIVASCGGELSAETGADSGTTVSVVLPAASPHGDAETD